MLKYDETTKTINVIFYSTSFMLVYIIHIYILSIVPKPKFVITIIINIQIKLKTINNKINYAQFQINFVYFQSYDYMSNNSSLNLNRFCLNYVFRLFATFHMSPNKQVFAIGSHARSLVFLLVNLLQFLQYKNHN